MRPEDPQPVTVAQALAELPRLLDTQSSRRRRGSGAFRMLGQPATGSGPNVITGGEQPESGDADDDHARTDEPGEITNMDAGPADAGEAEANMGATPTAEAPAEDTNQAGVAAADDLAEHTPA